ncbi:uncharacterized protein LACBIDRAFT_330194 [Laccaria bicolor S238N-H82]|uniref:Predicted protein n=1 Tax=Laccaria bicolor (strain S238N-H82 / ATCC MYA-4686) TaxID=486041 RepID=B0DKL3_LACBS|nr:uncharacterized protein LACBIDRAFT_330194 [Laccaria bicolor S238N-H82]EDR05086.1 predicted protein [Laccaria bicolor S238N-H82]|eukprot:XP_001884476.1 predicted protein [Laccaria bicolor S238N-H82]
MSEGTSFDQDSLLVGFHLGLAKTCGHRIVKTSTTTLVQDAVRKVNNQQVILKKVDTRRYPHEEEISSYFSSKELSDIPQNHCVPILETIRVPDEEHVVILVMPLLRPCKDPPFETIGEVVEFFRQVFEGMLFMHQHRIAHRDCHAPNVLVNADAMYPGGFHPAKQNMAPDWKGKAKHFTRTEHVPKYYFIDFGLSVRFGPDDSTPRARVVRGGDRDYPPELEDMNVEYDPFPTDVFHLGHLIIHEFTEGNQSLGVKKTLGLEFMEGLAADMTNPDPLKRPTMDEVVASHLRLLCLKVRSGPVIEPLRALTETETGYLVPRNPK